MATNSNTGTKFHLQKGLKFRVENGKIKIGRKLYGKATSACNRTNVDSHLENLKHFHSTYKCNPETCCKHCVVEYKRLMAEYKELNQK